jgi:uncharacterized membrane protein
MNIQPPNGFRGGRPFFDVHQVGGPSALAWTILALELLMLAALAFLIVRTFAFRPRPAGPLIRRHGPPDPLTHVRMRYANGEISREEYLQATRDLGEPTEELPAD